MRRKSKTKPCRKRQSSADQCVRESRAAEDQLDAVLREMVQGPLTDPGFDEDEESEGDQETGT